MSCAAKTPPAATRPSPTIAAAIGIAQSARARRRLSGSRRGRRSCCPCHTSTWSSHCPRQSAISPIRTRRGSTISRASAETMLTIAADPKHLGAKIGITAVLHTWGSTMTHHPHVHMIVPGGGISLDGSRWLSCRPRFFLPVPVFSKLFRGLMLAKLLAAHKAGQLQFFNQYAHLAEPKPFARYLAPLRRRKWYVYSKRPFGGPEAVLAYLSRHTHRVAISNRRLIALDENGVTFNYKDYRADGQA